jgi:hypothetical protein
MQARTHIPERGREGSTSYKHKGTHWHAQTQTRGRSLAQAHAHAYPSTRSTQERTHTHACTHTPLHPHTTCMTFASTPPHPTLPYLRRPCSIENGLPRGEAGLARRRKSSGQATLARNEAAALEQAKVQDGQRKMKLKKTETKKGHSGRLVMDVPSPEARPLDDANQTPGTVRHQSGVNGR